MNSCRLSCVATKAQYEVAERHHGALQSLPVFGSPASLACALGALRDGTVGGGESREFLHSGGLGPVMTPGLRSGSLEVIVAFPLVGPPPRLSALGGPLWPAGSGKTPRACG